jgi:hypothetical protein
MLRQAGPLREDGWFRSFREKIPVDADGRPLPWITYPAIEFLTPEGQRNHVRFRARLRRHYPVVGQAGREVVSVEHDRGWYEKVVSGAPGNVTVTHVPLDYGGAYAGKIAEHVKRFDIVVPDGRDRVNCARNSLTSLKDGGIIVWDNSDREEYEDGFRFLFDHGFRKIEFVGFAPGIVVRMETGIFYRPGNCLGI